MESGHNYERGTQDVLDLWQAKQLGLKLDARLEEVEIQLIKWFSPDGKPLTEQDIRRIAAYLERVKQGLDNAWERAIPFTYDPAGTAQARNKDDSICLERVMQGVLGRFGDWQGELFDTLVHELSHRYAKTVDNGYVVQYRNREHPTYKKKVAGDWVPVELSREELIQNADTYSGFVKEYYYRRRRRRR
jgi:hypothetical protein